MGETSRSSDKIGHHYPYSRKSLKSTAFYTKNCKGGVVKYKRCYKKLAMIVVPVILKTTEGVDAASATKQQQDLSNMNLNDGSGGNNNNNNHNPEKIIARDCDFDIPTDTTPIWMPSTCMECCTAVHNDEDSDEYLACLANPNRKHANCINFNTDSFPIGIDTFASCCMSPNEQDFVRGSLKPFKKKAKVKAFKQETEVEIKMQGTLRWSFQDNKGTVHKFEIENSFYTPDGSHRLLSPQHFALNTKSRLYSTRNFEARQRHNGNLLMWGNNHEFSRMVYNNRFSNVPIFYSAPSVGRYHIFKKEVDNKIKYKEKVAYAGVLVEDVMEGDEDDGIEIVDDTTERSAQVTTPPLVPSPSNEKQSKHQKSNNNDYDDGRDENIQDFIIDADNTDEINLLDSENYEQSISATSDRAELLRWHYRLGHLGFPRLQQLAAIGIIPRRLAKVRAPKCACCWYGKQTRKPWRVKSQRSHTRTSKTAGECISVDQMESTSLGFFGQMKGRLTKRKYRYATVFTDHYSKYTYVHLQENITSEQTVAAKVAFEAKMKDFGVTVQHYHADNGRFADNLFLKHIVQSGQTISYCGVNAHWQNGIAEKMIRDLRDAARTMLLHAIGRWPQAVDVALWPYALKHAANIRNQTPPKNGNKSPIEKILGTEVAPNLRHMHTFGCPVYALESRLQAGNPIDQWLPRARLGVYLGLSDKHARSVSLVLSTTTGLVSPQFHVQHDEFFETVSAAEKGKVLIWKNLAGLGKAKNKGTNVVTQENMPQQLEIIHRYNPGDTDNVNNPTSEPSTENTEVPNTSSDDDISPLDDPNYIPSFLPQSNESTAVSADSGENGTGAESQPTAGLRRSTRNRTPTLQARELPNLLATGAVALSATTMCDEELYYERLHDADYEIQEKMSDPIAFKASTDPDTLYYHQAMAADDKDEFVIAIVKEVNDHILNGHWELIPISQVPKGTKILDSVWSMKRKRDIKTRRVYKYKARLNLHGGQQIEGEHYDETYSPVISWPPLRLLTILAQLKGWHTRQIDFVLAFPQADIPYDNYMKLPHGIKTIHGNGDTHVLKLKKNLYGGRNAGKVWYDHLRSGLENIGFTKSRMDDCVFFRKDVIFVFYVDDGIWYSPSKASIDKAMKDLGNRKKAKRNLVFEDQGDVNDYLGINFDNMSGGRVNMTQPHIIDQIIKEVGLAEDAFVKQTPASPDKMLRRDIDELSVTPPFNYRKVIGKLSFLEKCTRPDIAYAVHQCARFCIDPKQSHVNAVVYLARYLKATKNDGIIFAADPTKSFEVWVDADFSGNWTRTKREFIDEACVPKVYCKAFEDNSGALEMAKVHKMRPRTKHINIVYHHFRSAVKSGVVTIHKVDTTEQLADMLTKPLSRNLLHKFRRRIQKWGASFSKQGAMNATSN